MALIVAAAASTPATLPAGEITTTRYVVGGTVGTVAGFGIGHAIQRRFRPRGAVIMGAEISGLVVLVAGAIGSGYGGTAENRRNQGYIASAGALVFLGTRVVEIVDLWAGPTWKHGAWRVAPLNVQEPRRPGLVASLDL